MRVRGGSWKQIIITIWRKRLIMEKNTIVRKRRRDRFRNTNFVDGHCRRALAVFIIIIFGFVRQYTLVKLGYTMGADSTKRRRVSIDNRGKNYFYILKIRRETARERAMLTVNT